MNSREKGKRGELELARALRALGYDCRRGQQYSGANGDADVVGLPGVHIECKRVERLNLYDAMAQAKHDATEGETPVVAHRKDRCVWLVTLELEDFITEFYREWEAGNHVQNLKNKEAHPQLPDPPEVLRGGEAGAAGEGGDAPGV